MKTMAKDKKKRSKLHGSQPTQTRQVTRQTVCPHCKGKFWAPQGKKCMCPWCGEYLIAIDGYQGSSKGFWTKLLEGIAESEGVVDIEVK